MFSSMPAFCRFDDSFLTRTRRIAKGEEFPWSWARFSFDDSFLMRTVRIWHPPKVPIVPKSSRGLELYKRHEKQRVRVLFLYIVTLLLNNYIYEGIFFYYYMYYNVLHSHIFWLCSRSR